MFLIIAVTIAACRSGHAGSDGSPVVRGDYYGQIPPGDTAKLFAPNTFSTGMNDRDFAITPDGNEIFFCREVGNYRYTTIFYTHRDNGQWTVPEVFEYCTEPAYKFIEPHISADGKKLYFISNMPADSTSDNKEDIWVSTKADGRWSKPVNLGPPVNTKSKEFFPSVTYDGTIYYTQLDTIASDEFIYRSRLVNGIYQEPEKLGPNVNIGKARYNAFVARDESYIIIPAFGMDDSYGATDYYISFRDSLDNWSLPINMGPEINSSNPREWSASVTTDGKYLFFMSARMDNDTLSLLSRQSMFIYHNSPQNGNTDIYWISTGVIEKLRSEARF
jgi:hypothetical protein